MNTLPTASVVEASVTRGAARGYPVHRVVRLDLRTGQYKTVVPWPQVFAKCKLLLQSPWPGKCNV